MSALVGRGYRVLIPFGGGHPYDLAVDADGAFIRVQCKLGWESGGCILFNTRGTDHGNGALSYVGRADIFGVYFQRTEAVFLVPVGAVASHEGTLRLTATRNNQRRGIRIASDFGVDCWDRDSLAALCIPTSSA